MSEDMTNCPKCGSDAIYRDSVDVGVGIMYGPYGCPDCAWSEYEEYDFSDGRTKVQENGSVLDQWGGLYPKNSPVAKAVRLADQNK